MVVGVVLLASAGRDQGAQQYKDPYYFLKRQVAWPFSSVIRAGFQ